MYGVENLKPNSYASKEKTEKKEKNIEKVVEGSVVERKRSAFRHFLDLFIAEDIGSVKKYVLVDVIIPAIQNAFLDAIRVGSETMILGGGQKSSGSVGQKVQYTKFSKTSSSPLTGSIKAKAYTSDESAVMETDVVFESRAEAEAVVSSLIDLIEVYGSASVADFYELIGKTPDFTDNKYGWTNLGRASTRRVRDGYVINLPKIHPLSD